MLTFTLIFFVAAISSFVSTPIVRTYAQRIGLVDTPKEDRQIHIMPTPRAGGIAIFLSFVVALALLFFLRNGVAANFRAGLSHNLLLLLPAAAMFLLGVADDFFRLSARVKLIFQVLIAIFFYFFTARITVLVNPFGTTPFDVSWVSLPVTIIWLVGITNAFNLIDGIDGLSAGSALFATLAMLFIALVQGNLLVTVMACALAGSILGFLKYNFNPATIFMGDSGSLFIGFTLAALSIDGAQKSTTVVAIAIPLVSFGLPIMETLLSMARRFLAGQPLFSADRRHIHHQLLAKGLSQRQVVILLYAVSAVYALVSLLFIDSPIRLVGFIMLVFGVSAWIGIQHLDYHEFGEIGRLFQRSLLQRTVMINNIRIHNALTALEDANSADELLTRLDECFRAINFSRVELRLNNAIFAEIKEHANFIIANEDGHRVFAWLNAATDNATLPPQEMIEMRLPLGTKANLGQLVFSHHFQQGPIPFDVNLLFGSLRVKLESTIKKSLPSSVKQQVELVKSGEAK